nr:MAG TPA: hypothetical protein [Caudoviricetes sp.]
MYRFISEGVVPFAICFVCVIKPLTRDEQAVFFFIRQLTLRLPPARYFQTW